MVFTTRCRVFAAGYDDDLNGASVKVYQDVWWELCFSQSLENEGVSVCFAGSMCCCNVDFKVIEASLWSWSSWC